MRVREGIRRQAAQISHDCGEATTDVYHPAYIVDQLEQVVLAVCNLAETLDADRHEPLSPEDAMEDAHRRIRHGEDAE